METRFVVVCVVCLTGSLWADGVGFHEIGGTNVPSGATRTFAGSLQLSPEATYLKTGAGTLELPVASIDAAAPYGIDVLNGKLKLTGAASTTAPTAPAVAQTAALWLDASNLALGDLSEWEDVRGAGHCTALARTTNETSGVTVKVTVTNGVKCVDFGGNAGKYMRFQKNGSNTEIDKVQHFFVVHGMRDWWGAPLGRDVSGWSYGMCIRIDNAKAPLATTQSNGNPLLTKHFEHRGDIDAWNFQARFFLDGKKIDPYVEPPREGFQLFEGDLLTKPNKYNSLFCSSPNGSNVTPGGDFMSEVLLFTNRLSEAQRLDVERYLMKKWGLPSHVAKDKSNVPGQVASPHGTGTIRVESGASAEVSCAAGETTEPFAFVGEGTVTKTGAGTLLLGGGESHGFTGSFTLQEGSLLMRGGAMPPTMLGSGETWSAVNWPGGRTTNDGSGDVTSGVRVVRSTGGTVGTVRKNGVGELCFKGADASVRRIRVEEGTLHLIGPETNSTYAVRDTGVGDVEVYVPNHSFEMPFSITSNNRCGNIPANTESNFWVATSQSHLQFVDCRPSAGNGYYGTWSDYPPPDGGCAMMILYNADVSTSVTVPRAGIYELSLYANSRRGNSGSYGSDGKMVGLSDADKRRSVIDVKFAGRTVAHLRVNKAGFAPYRCRFAVTADEAGAPQRLGFKSLRSYTDNCTLIDDIHLRAVAETARVDVVPVPGGDFENSDVVTEPGTTPTGLDPLFTRQISSEGWNLSISGAAASETVTNGYVSVCAGGSVAYFKGGSTRSIAFFPYAEFPCGASVLGFLGNCGTAAMDASTTATLTPGRWLLRAKAASRPTQVYVPWELNVSSPVTYLSQPCLSATVIRGDSTTTSLGIVPVQTHALAPVVWTNAFEVAAGEQVRISLTQTISSGNCFVDDLEFVPATSAQPEVNLFPDPGCEKASLWTKYVYDSGVKYSNEAGKIMAYNSESWAWGYDAFEGDHGLRCHNDAGMYINVSFPAAGLYRITFHARSRANAVTYAKLPIRGFVRLEDGTEMEVFRTKIPYLQSFQEYSYLFRMPEAGRRQFCIHGLGIPSGNLDASGKDKADRTTVVDGITLVKVDDARQSMPDIPRNAQITVAEDTSLVLDFDGALKVRSLIVNGQRVTGYADATTHPGYITGMGTLAIVPDGSTITIR